MQADWQTCILKGNDAFQRRKLEEAIEYFDKAVNQADSELQLAEAFHYLALAHLKKGNAVRYFESEKLAAAYYAHFDAGQAADFMKTAGDMLRRVRRCNEAIEAYSSASEYFRNQSLVEKDESWKAGWKGWELFCRGKTGENSSVNFKRAADSFLEAGKASKNRGVKTSRIAESQMATAARAREEIRDRFEPNCVRD